MFRGRPGRGEDGNAMLVMVMTTSVSALLTIAALSVSSGALRQGEAGRREEGARALADAGASRALSNLTSDPAYVTHTSVPKQIDTSWVLSAAAGAPAERTGEGEFAWVVPAGAGQVVYGVGYVPSRDAPRQTRVVKVSYERVNPSGFGAIATEGSLTIGGNASIEGVGGSAITNRDLTLTGSSSVSGDAKAAGSYVKAASASVGGTGGGGYPAVLLPQTDPRAYRSLTTHDLCPDATVRLTAPAPCTGTIVATGLGSGWQGWEFSGTTWRVGSNSASPGAVYVYGSSVRITGNPGSSSSPWLVTIVTEALKLGTTKTNGDVEITGNPDMRPYTAGVGVVADRDFVSSGSSSLEGLVLAGEQVSLTGNGTLHGQVIATGSVDTAASPVGANVMTGSFALVPESAAPSITGGVEPTDWRQI